MFITKLILYQSIISKVMDSVWYFFNKDLLVD